MLDTIVSRHGISSDFWQLTSCYYPRTMYLEETFCIPFTVVRKGPITEILYTLRYADVKQRGGRVQSGIRQSAVYHQYNAAAQQSLYILFSPTPNSTLHQRSEELLHGESHTVTRRPFWLHERLFEIHFPTWRQYLLEAERKFLPIVCVILCFLFSRARLTVLERRRQILCRRRS